jgi:hypothetical protein
VACAVSKVVALGEAAEIPVAAGINFIRHGLRVSRGIVGIGPAYLALRATNSPRSKGSASWELRRPLKCFQLAADRHSISVNYAVSLRRSNASGPPGTALLDDVGAASAEMTGLAGTRSNLKILVSISAIISASTIWLDFEIAVLL